MLRRLLPTFVLLTATPSLAQDDIQEPEEAEEVSTDLNGVGRISIQGGWRVTSNETLYKSWYGRTENAALPRARESAGGPLFVASFAYAITDMVELGIDLFGTGGRLYLNEPLVGEPGAVSERRIDTLTYGALVGLRFQTVLPEVGPYGLVPFAGILTGPSLVSSQRAGEDIQETTTQAWVGSLGASLRLSPRWGVTGEYRLAFVRGPVGPPDAQNRRIGSFSTGGNWFTLGVTYSFPAEPTRPLPSGL
ncbi:hypothetical protein ACLESO_51185 [Pyxidicoccus sp. 3LG]